MEQLPEFPPHAPLPAQAHRRLPHHPSALAPPTQHRQTAPFCQLPQIARQILPRVLPEQELNLSNERLASCFQQGD